jgi:hypothetical protein
MNKQPDQIAVAGLGLHNMTDPELVEAIQIVDGAKDIVDTSIFASRQSPFR